MQIEKSKKNYKKTRHSAMIWLILLTFVVFITWSSYALVDEVVRGPGVIVPSRKAQVVQNLEGGILSTLFVREGDIVKKGEALAELSDTKFKGSFGELEEQAVSLEIKLLRLQAELEKQNTLDIPDALIAKAPETAVSEQQLFNARRLSYQSQHSTSLETANLRKREVELLQPMVKRGIVPEIDLLRAQQSASEAVGNLVNLEGEHELLLAEEYSETLNELNQLKQLLSVREDQLQRRSLVSPARGIVNKISMTTIGGVLDPGEEIIEITPLDDEMRVEARIPPKDIAFIRPNMRSTVKLTAYDYTIYGSLEGKVAHISADTFKDEQQQNAEPYYKVIVTVEKDKLETKRGVIEIRPGMTADVELHTGEKTILQYLLKPLFKTTEAFTER